jgi:hypothetical protein
MGKKNKLETPVEYARTCNVTGKGMNMGWYFNDGDYYCKYKKDAINYIKTLISISDIGGWKYVDVSDLTDDVLLQIMEEEQMGYWTDWSDELNELEEKDLDFYDTGDGISYELWEDKNGTIYNVPIEIVRYFKNKSKK